MRSLIVTAAIAGFTAVALGAFGAHGLEAKLNANALGWWQTATHYLLVHAVAGLSVGLSGRTRLAAAGWLMVLGGLLFAATLYAMALGAPRILGMVTPIGGLGMLAGWAFVGAAALHHNG